MGGKFLELLGVRYSEVLLKMCDFWAFVSEVVGDLSCYMVYLWSMYYITGIGEVGEIVSFMVG